MPPSNDFIKWSASKMGMMAKGSMYPIFSFCVSLSKQCMRIIPLKGFKSTTSSTVPTTAQARIMKTMTGTFSPTLRVPNPNPSCSSGNEESDGCKFFDSIFVQVIFILPCLLDASYFRNNPQIPLAIVADARTICIQLILRWDLS